MSNTYTPKELLEHWNTQQQAYVELRQLRIDTMVFILQKHAERLGRSIRVLDFGCGPGSLGNAILSKMDNVEIVGVDVDPILLRLAKETNEFANKMQFHKVVLTDDNWQDTLPHKNFDAIVSTTALHWLQPDQLAKLYVQLPQILRPQAIFLNADHLFYNAHTEKFLNDISWQIRTEYTTKKFAEGIMSWDDWWHNALNYIGWEDEAELWYQIFDKRLRSPVRVSVDFHLSALQAAGFVETAQIFKWFDDNIVFAKIPDGGVLKSRTL